MRYYWYIPRYTKYQGYTRYYSRIRYLPQDIPSIPREQAYRKVWRKGKQYGKQLGVAMVWLVPCLEPDNPPLSEQNPSRHVDLTKVEVRMFRCSSNQWSLKKWKKHLGDLEKELIFLIYQDHHHVCFLIYQDHQHVCRWNPRDGWKSQVVLIPLRLRPSLAKDNADIFLHEGTLNLMGWSWLIPSWGGFPVDLPFPTSWDITSKTTVVMCIYIYTYVYIYICVYIYIYV